MCVEDDVYTLCMEVVFLHASCVHACMHHVHACMRMYNKCLESEELSLCEYNYVMLTKIFMGEFIGSMYMCAIQMQGTFSNE